MAMQERTFSQAEMELFQGKYEAFTEAQKNVEEIVSFLKKQHGIFGDEGWQVGQSGFFKMVEETPAPNADATPNNGEETKAKKPAASS